MAWTTAAAGQPITADLWNADVRNQTISRCTSSTRPAAATAGQYIYETDTYRTYLYDGSTWVLVGGHAAWVTYTPTLTASTTNPTLGSGSSVSGRYWRDGKFCHVQATINFGSSGVAAGSGIYRVSLPFTASANAQNITGSIFGYDSSAAGGIGGWAVVGPSVAYATLNYNLDTFYLSSVTNALPWVWAAGDQINVSITYETA